MPLIHASAEMAPDAPNYVVDLEAAILRRSSRGDAGTGDTPSPAPTRLTVVSLRIARCETCGVQPA